VYSQVFGEKKICGRFGWFGLFLVVLLLPLFFYSPFGGLVVFGLLANFLRMKVCVYVSLPVCVYVSICLCYNVYLWVLFPPTLNSTPALTHILTLILIPTLTLHSISSTHTPTYPPQVVKKYNVLDENECCCGPFNPLVNFLHNAISYPCSLYQMKMSMNEWDEEVGDDTQVVATVLSPVA
jgi:hypothetical protein